MNPRFVGKLFRFFQPSQGGIQRRDFISVLGQKNGISAFTLSQTEHLASLEPGQVLSERIIRRLTVDIVLT